MTNKFKLLDVVILAKDLPERKLHQGAMGTMLEIFNGNDQAAYEIEFMDADGHYADPKLRSIRQFCGGIFAAQRLVSLKRRQPQE